jgi:hypothetical protein
MEGKVARRGGKKERFRSSSKGTGRDVRARNEKKKDGNRTK